MNIAAFVTARFDRWRRHIDYILSRHDWYMSADDVYKACANCQKCFFDNGEAFAVVNVVEYPKARYLHIMLAGGTTEGIKKLHPVIYRFGQEIGATKATFIGRKGFSRALKGLGWKTPHVYYEMEIL